MPDQSATRRVGLPITSVGRPEAASLSSRASSSLSAPPDTYIQQAHLVQSPTLMSRYRRFFSSSSYSRHFLFSNLNPRRGITTVAMASAVLNVSTPTRTGGEGHVIQGKSERPAHHVNDNKTLFRNPWPSSRFVLIVPATVSRLDCVRSMSSSDSWETQRHAKFLQIPSCTSHPKN